jgi:hypothetical protein
VAPHVSEEPAKLNREVARRAAERCDRILYFLTLFTVNSCPKITHLFWLDFIKTYTIMHQKQSFQYVIGFSYEKSEGHRHRRGFLFGKILLKNAYDLFRGATSTEEK